MNKQRVLALDIARGIGIILVVAGHAERGLVSAGIAQGNWWQAFDLALYTFHMPLFMLLAGINVPDSLAKGRWVFARQKFISIAYPYVIWSLVQGTLMVLLARFTNAGEVDWAVLAQIGWRPISPFWFLYALFVYMMIVAFFGARAVVLVPLAVTGLAASAILTGDTILHQLSYQACFFVLGVLGANTLRRWPFRPVLGWTLLAVGCWFLAFQIVPTEMVTPYLTPWSLPAALAGIAFVMGISQIPTGPLALGLAYIGKASLTIYVMHILATAGTRILLVRAGVAMPEVAMWGVVTAIGVAGPLLAHIILGRNGVLPLLGLGRRKRIAVSSPDAQ